MNDSNYSHIREMTIRNSEKLDYITERVDDIDNKIKKCVLPSLRRVDVHETYFKIMGAFVGIVVTLTAVILAKVL